MSADMYEILVTFDALDAVVSRCLEQAHYVEYERRAVGNGRVVYKVSSYSLGVIGTIELRTLRAESTWLHIEDAPVEVRELTAAELAAVASIDVRAKGWQRLHSARSQRFNLLREALGDVMDWNLGHVWAEANTGAASTSRMASDEQPDPIDIRTKRLDIPSNMNERRRIELLYLIYVAAWNSGESNFPVSLGGIGHDMGKDRSGLPNFWRTAAEDLAYRKLIELRGNLDDDDVVYMMPAGREQVEKWKIEYQLDQRLVVDELREKALRETAKAVADRFEDGWTKVGLPQYRIDWNKEIGQNERITRIRDQATEWRREGLDDQARRYEKLADALEERYAAPPPREDPPIQWVVSEQRYKEITEELVILGQIDDEERERDPAYLRSKIEVLENRVEKLLADISPTNTSLEDKTRETIKKMFTEGYSDVQIGFKVGLGDSRVKQIRLEIGLKRQKGRKKN